jgi:hypothetical protein
MEAFVTAVCFPVVAERPELLPGWKNKRANKTVMAEMLL